MGLDDKKYQELLHRIEKLEKENAKLRNQDETFLKPDKKDPLDSYEFLTTITNTMPGHIAMVDADNLIYQFVNNAFEESFGLPVEKIIGSHIKDIIGESNYQFALKYIDIVKKGESISYENVFHLKTGDRWVKVNYVPHFDRNRNVKSIIVLSYDITEKKQAEIELRIANSTKDKFFSIIAHDLKSPFNSIIGFSELLLENINVYDKEKTTEFLKAINTSSKNAFELLGNLLEWARTQTGMIAYHPERINLKELVTSIKTESESLFKTKNISLTLEVPDNLFVLADKNMLRTIFRNLLTNAFKFTQVVGEIIILAKVSAEYVEVEVRDNGTGMKKEVLDILFKVDEWFTSKGTNEEKGSGIGVAICKEFVEKHGGQIWATSELNVGTSLYFTLPFFNN